MRITECFDSIQGEGPAMGLPCTFIRFSGCNLRCAWCDTPRSSWEPKGEDRSLADLLTLANRSPGRTVVITGGEPFQSNELGPLCDALRQAGHPVHLETSGTLFQPVEVDLVCMSPKLSSSTPDPVFQPAWNARHEALRFPVETLREFLHYYERRLWLKFVVASKEDLDEVESWLATVGVCDRSQVMLMPQASSPQVLSELGAQVAEWCLERGYRYSDRLHIRLWGDVPGK